MAANTDLDRAFQANLREVRKTKGLTQAEVADRLGVSQAAYSSIENGKASPSLSTIVRVAKALKIDPVDLLGAVST